MTTAQAVNNNNPIEDYVHPDDQTQPTFEMTPGFKPFTIIITIMMVCLRGSRTKRVPCDIKNVDIDVEVVEGAIQSDYWCVSLLSNGKYSSIAHWERYLIFLSFLVLFLLRMQLTLKIVFFKKSKWIVLIEMKRVRTVAKNWMESTGLKWNEKKCAVIHVKRG